MNDKELHKSFLRITNRWWFYPLFLLMFFIPSYTEEPINPEQNAALVIDVLSNALIFAEPLWFPVLKVLMGSLLIILFKFRNRVGRLFSSYVAFSLILVAVFQNMAITEGYGFSVLTGNMLITLFVAGTWIWEIIVAKNNYENINLNAAKWIILLLALLALWYPINTETLEPDFDLLLLLTSESALTFCMLIPVYLCVLILIYPNVNALTLRVTSLAGLITGLLNIIQFFILNSFTWMGILHLPLLILSLYGFVLSLRVTQSILKRRT